MTILGSKIFNVNWDTHGNTWIQNILFYSKKLVPDIYTFISSFRGDKSSNINVHRERRDVHKPDYLIHQQRIFDDT